MLGAVDDVLRRRSVGAPAARSTQQTVLGEFLLPRPEGAWQEALIGSLKLLGFTPSAARQAVVRSAREGWLEGERVGRRSRMRLTASSAELLRDGARRIYGFGGPVAWDGRWLLLVLRVPEPRRELRHRLTTQLAWAGFGSLGGGLWITPHVERERELTDVDSVAELLSFQASLGTLGDPANVPAEAWDLEAVAAAYRDFVARFGRLRPKTPEAVFRAQTQLVHEWRKFPFLDPDLPEAMLPVGWPRAHALVVFRNRHESWHAPAQDYFHSLEALRDAAEAARGILQRCDVRQAVVAPARRRRRPTPVGRDRPRAPALPSPLVAEPTTDLIPPMPSGAMVGAFRASSDFKLHELSGERVRATMALGEAHHQPFGIVHGGIYALAVEGVASAGACAAVADRNQYAVGTSNTTDFLRPVSAALVEVLAEPIFQGRTQQLWNVEIRRTDDGKLVAKGQLRLQNVPFPD